MALTVVVDTEYLKEIEKARRDIRALIASKNCTPIMLRLAWHDAGTYDKNTNTGGPNGSIRNEQELSHGSNKGLKIAIDFCEGVKAKLIKVTYADIYQLAGVVAVEVTGGPTIEFVPGRKDSMVCSRDGLLPDAQKGASHLRDIFYRMGLSDKDIVALSGGLHTMGRAHPDRSGFGGPWIEDYWMFDNSYFVELLKGDSEGLLKLPTDKALVQDPEFRRYVELYAKEKEEFFKDYAESHMKLSELGFPPASKAAAKCLMKFNFLEEWREKFNFLKEAGEDIQLAVPSHLKPYHLCYPHILLGQQSDSFGYFYPLHSDFQTVICGLINRLKDLHSDRICTSRNWKEADVRRIIFKKMVDAKRRTLVVKLITPLASFQTNGGEIERSRDINRLGVWLAQLMQTHKSSAELTNLIKKMINGNLDKFPLLNHPVLLSHEKRLNLVFSISRDVQVLTSKARQKFEKCLETQLKGYVTTPTDPLNWHSKIHGYTPPPHTQTPVFPSKNLLCCLDDIPNGTNVSMLRFMGDVRENLMGNAYKMFGWRMKHEDMDCWLSGTFDMALVGMVQILWDNGWLNKVTDIIV